MPSTTITDICEILEAMNWIDTEAMMSAARACRSRSAVCDDERVASQWFARADGLEILAAATRVIGGDLDMGETFLNEAAPKRRDTYIMDAAGRCTRRYKGKKPGMAMLKGMLTATRRALGSAEANALREAMIVGLGGSEAARAALR